MDTLVSTQWLAEHRDDDALIVVDATMHLPASGRNARDEYSEGHLPGARFLDLATLTNTSAAAPFALPTPEQFARRMESIGISNADKVVLYDDSAIKSAARAWFTFRSNGMTQVAVLDGGAAKWRAEDRPIETIQPQYAPARFTQWTATQPSIRTKADILDLVRASSPHVQIVDARDAARFSGSVEDRVHGLPGGHIPGARNVCFAKLYRDDGTLRSAQSIAATFADAGVLADRPIITSCGSGVTACSLLLALERIGATDAALYDGSWSEWGSDPDTPKQIGPAD